MNLDAIRKLDIGENELMAEDMSEIINYAEQFGRDSWFYMVTAAYKLGFVRGLEADGENVS